VLAGDPNAVNRDVAHYFDSSKFALPGVCPAYDGTGDRNYIRPPADFANDMTDVKLMRVIEIGLKYRF
jgi:hypothetical protein